MPGPNITKLLILQDRDLAIARIERELNDIPKHKEEITARLEEHKQAQEAAKEAVKLQQARMKDLELQIETEKERLAKLKTQQMQLKTNVEFKAMEKEIFGGYERIKTLEDSELVIMADIEKAEKVLSAREVELADEEALVNADLSGMDARSSNMAKELAEAQAERDGASDGVDKEWMKLYSRLAKNKAGAVLVSVDRGVCTGCHMQLPPQSVHSVAREDNMVSCAYCGRLLYKA